MIFNPHYDLVGLHAFLGASKYHWINYDEDKLKLTYMRHLAVEKGTKLHDFAKTCIELKQKLPKSKKTLNMYVNDAIGFRMIPEQVLYYSNNCFGTADSILFDDRTNFLRIHDLKTGETPAHMEQLMIYAALFCLEYAKKPTDLSGIELRIYQNDQIIVHNPEPEEIQEIMNKIVIFSNEIDRIRTGAYYE
ncbi:MAG: DUF2800 domain-containing protein [Alphaproteobacteria bacterium]|nr:DUF2800 domain-containing protein [Alphaproteobacteria bacterium]